MVDPVEGPLCRLVGRVGRELRPGLSGAAAEELDRVLAHLSEPIQLAVAGRIKSGKSTVVNALIGRRVAATDVRECTRLVTRFRYGEVDRVEVVDIDGGRHTVPYDAAGAVPDDLGVPVERIAHLDAFCTSAVLRSLTILDTPGLGSADAGAGAVLDRGSRHALDSADALLYVLTQTARVDDVRALSDFRARTVPELASPLNAIGVLNKADQLDAADPLALARSIAGEQARLLRQQVRAVLPLAGLLAETTGTGNFTEADGDLLRRLARVEPARRDLLLGGVDLFMAPDPELPRDGRRRLLERLDLFGVRYLTELLVADPTLATGDLRRRLADRSGSAPLRDFIDQALGRHADGIKAHVALTALRGIGVRAAPHDRQAITDAVERLAQRPQAHQLRIVAAAALVASGVVSVPPELAAELERLASGGDAGRRLGAPHLGRSELAELALRRAGHWRGFATGGAPPGPGRIAQVLHRGYVLLWQQLQAPESTAGDGA